MSEPAAGGVLRFRLSAPEDHPLYLENCNGDFSWGLERQGASAWEPAWIVAINACLSPPIVIAPGESRDFREAVTLNAGETLPADAFRIAVYGLYSSYSLGDRAASEEVAHERRVSSPFDFGPLTGQQ